jgi:hypothetical protein
MEVKERLAKTLGVDIKQISISINYWFTMNITHYNLVGYILI